MTSANLLSEWSRLFVESLVDAGIRDLVVSPGSRSTPLVWAAMTSGRLRLHSIVDERVAGFYALGYAKIKGVPAAVLCTSGSAAASYFPAIVEASLSHSPLLVLTADRPFELMDCGASQTIDQTKIFGDHVRRFMDVGMPDDGEASLVALRRKAVQCVMETLYPVPGPVHVNFRARKPLEPERGAETPEAAARRGRVTALLGRALPRVATGKPTPEDEALAPIVESCLTARRGLVVCGPASTPSAVPTEALGRLVRALGFPIYAEATSQHRFSQAFPAPLLADALDTLLGSPRFLAAGAPDVVLQIGATPVSGAFERLVSSTPTLTRHVLSPHGYPDPQGNATTVVVAYLEATVSRLASLVEADSRQPSASSAWAEQVTRANDRAWSAIDGVLASLDSLSEGAAVRRVVGRLPAGTVLAVGNSLPVRHVDTFCRAGATRDITVVSQRGAAGIDGVVASAAGSALAAGRPTVLLVGDVSALHDLAGLAAARLATTPLVVVVLNNDGGRIFEQLPLSRAGLPEDAWPLWTTPHGRSFGAAAAFFDLPYSLVETEPQLDAALDAALGRQGATLVEVKVPPHGAKRTLDAIAAAVDSALAS